MSAKVQEEYSQDDASTGSYGSHTSSNSNSKLGGLSNSLNSTDSNKNVNIRETTKMLQKDIWVRRIRVITIFVFLVAAITISMVVYISLKDSERREFEQRFADQSAHVRRSVHAELASKFSAIDALATTLTSYAGSRSGGWPNITLPEFSYRATSTLNIGRGISVGVQPIVYKHKLNEWEEFSVGTQGWRRDGLDFQTMFPNALDPSEHTHDHDYRKLMFIDIVQNISSRIFSVDDGVPTMVDNDIMMPVWQHTPVHQMLPWVNYDVFSRNDNRPALTEVMNNQNAVLGLYFELSESSHGHDFPKMNPMYEEMEWVDIWSGNHDDHHMHSGIDDSGHSERDHGIHNHPDHGTLFGPATNIWYPVFSNFTKDRELVTIISMTVRWDSFFQPSLPPNANGFIAVVSNPCNQTFTFELTGNEVIYLGPEDLHDIAYNKYADSSLMTSSGSSFTDIGLSETYCPYKIEVFPSTQMQDAFVTNRPLMFTMGVTSIFVFTGLIFIFYDYLVHRRQRFLAEAAYKSNAIVSALFPQIVRDRLFDDTNRSAQKGLKHFVNQTSAPTLDQREDLMKKAPIADLFTNATVMFGDISGFTAWSSTRQPTEVFVLLETLYGAFDKIARHMEVFKVETIGDCYVAVTGLPVPQEDHHLRMVRFARHTLEKMSVLTRELEVSLGPDTTNLGFRIGLHSGPVTAGVLRGEKSRFQLFGDTVNTASRMESTGRPNAIQISQSTADLLLACGKSYWMRKREELVQAKGKGEIQTYWIKTKVASAEKKEGSESSLESQRQNSDIWQGVEDHKSTRNGIRNTLIEWQVELLSRLLKQIVLHRESKKGKKIHEPLINLDVINTQPRDQIAEKIVMPAFDSHATRKSLKASVELPENVVTQLHDLVTTIALLYHDNHFHNYEHACHVTMSANKLLSRIVVPANLESSAIGSGLGLKQAHDYTYGLTSDPLTQFAVVFSAIVHDIDHHGVSNAQLTKENNRLASVYQEKSIAEQNSIDLAFEILTASTYSELVSCICADEKEYKRFRQLVINCVMATDIFDKQLLEMRNNRWIKAFNETEDCFDLKATIVIEHIMQAADVSHTMQHWHVYQKWNEKLFAEICRAYESGRGPDKDPALGWYKGELWFFDNYVIPLAKKLDECGVFGVCSDECLNYALENRKEWESKGQKVVQDMAKRYKRPLREEKSES